MAKTATVEVPIIEKKLPELIAGFVQRILENPATANQCAYDLQIWHDAQPIENRQELVKENRKVIERAKQATEYLFQQYVMIAAKDM